MTTRVTLQGCRPARCASEHSGTRRWVPVGAPGLMSRQELGPGHLWVQEGGRGEPTLLQLPAMSAANGPT